MSGFKKKSEGASLYTVLKEGDFVKIQLGALEAVVHINSFSGAKAVRLGLGAPKEIKFEVHRGGERKV